jgi:glucose-1-phosphate cytidylyltransferase
MELAGTNKVSIFKEKPAGDGQWINGGYFVLSPGVFDYLGEHSDNIMWEDQPLEKLSKDGQLMAYKHSGFWKCMDAMRDKIELENLWNNQKAKWKVW